MSCGMLRRLWILRVCRCTVCVLTYWSKLWKLKTLHLCRLLMAVICVTGIVIWVTCNFFPSPVSQYLDEEPLPLRARSDDIFSLNRTWTTARQFFPWKPHKVKEVDCARLFAGDTEELNRSKKVELPPLPTEDEIQSLTRNCKSFRQEYGFIMSSLTEKERNFSIAYSIVVFGNVFQVLQLLQAIYRPQNFYCIHIDKKSSRSFSRVMAAIAHCFYNVFLTSRNVDVVWGKYTTLEPELICMQELWRFRKWKYFINLTGQEFPLRTNWELVRILTAYNGANDVSATLKRVYPDMRWRQAGEAPHGILPVKGSVHIAVNRDFVDFVLHSGIAQDFLAWNRLVEFPEETFFSSLNHNPHLGIRGSYKGVPETDPVEKPFLARFKNWGSYPFNYSCADEKRVRFLCIWSAGDLPLLDQRPEMFANKFYQNYSRVAIECLHERLYNHTRDEFLGRMDFSTNYYENLSYVKNMVTAEEAKQANSRPA